MTLPIPINLDTINRLYGLSLTSTEVAEFFSSLAEPTGKINTSEDVVVSKIGRELYEKFFRGYTRKQWGLDPSELDASSLRACRCAPIATTATSRTCTRPCRCMATRGCLKVCSIIRISKFCLTPTIAT